MADGDTVPQSSKRRIEIVEVPARGIPSHPMRRDKETREYLNKLAEETQDVHKHA